MQCRHERNECTSAHRQHAPNPSRTWQNKNFANMKLWWVCASVLFLVVYLIATTCVRGCVRALLANGVLFATLGDLGSHAAVFVPSAPFSRELTVFSGVRSKVPSTGAGDRGSNSCGGRAAWQNTVRQSHVAKCQHASLLISIRLTASGGREGGRNSCLVALEEPRMQAIL